MTKSEIRSAGQHARVIPRVPRVVCIDDEPHVLASLKRLLRGEPYELRTTTDPEEALIWIREDGAAVVVADYRMPRMSGPPSFRSRRRPRPVRAGSS